MTSALLTDLYQLTMVQGYFLRRRDPLVAFELFFRRAPFGGSYALLAGAEEAVDMVSALRFTPDELAYLRSLELFREEFLAFLAGWRFRGALHAVPEGTAVFPGEPLLRVTARLTEAQLSREHAAQHDQLPDPDRHQGGAHRAGGRRRAGAGVRAAPRPGPGRRAVGRPRRLHRRRAGHLQRGRRPALRHPGGRHHGALLDPVLRQRAGGVRPLRRVLSRSGDPAGRHLRHAGERHPPCHSRVDQVAGAGPRRLRRPAGQRRPGTV